MNSPVFISDTAVISWMDSSGLHIRVYSSDGNIVTERCSDTGGPGWTNGSFKQSGSQVSATVWQDSAGPHLRVYCSAQGDTTEWCSDPGTAGWTKGAFTTH